MFNHLSRLSLVETAFLFIVNLSHFLQISLKSLKKGVDKKIKPAILEKVKVIYITKKSRSRELITQIIYLRYIIIRYL